MLSSAMDTGYTPVFDIFCVCGRISAGSNKKRPYKRSCYDKRGFPRECLSRSGSAGCAKPGMANNRHPVCRFGVLGNRSSYVRASCAPLPGALCLLTVLVYHRVMDKLWPMLEEMEKKRGWSPLLNSPVFLRGSAPLRLPCVRGAGCPQGRLRGCTLDAAGVFLLAQSSWFAPLSGAR